MKKILFSTLCMLVAFSLNAATQKIGFDNLPKKSQEFIRTYLPDQMVKFIEKDRKDAEDRYTVYFNNGNQVSFKGSEGVCSQIIFKQGSIPTNFLPNAIASYLSTHYNNAKITMIDHHAKGYHIALTDGTILDFDNHGKFIKATKR